MRLKSRYKNSVAEVPALETEAAATVPVAASESLDDASAALRGQLGAMRGAEAAARLEAIDDAVEATREVGVDVDKPDASIHVEPANDAVDVDAVLASVDLPPLAKHWLKNNPDYLYDPEKNARIQALHYVLVDDGYEEYGQDYFLEMDRRLNGHGGVPFTEEKHIDRLTRLQRELDDVKSLPPEEQDIPLAEIKREFAEIEAEMPEPTPAQKAMVEARLYSNARQSAPVRHEPSRRVPVSAPPSREPSWSNRQSLGRNARITLTAQQREAAKIAGISETEYAANLLRLMQAKADGHYGGQG